MNTKIRFFKWWIGCLFDEYADVYFNISISRPLEYNGREVHFELCIWKKLLVIYFERIEK